ncbi:twin-arginine translocation signal domain-containing protein [bacterium]|nr:MAG: twin-arginine translocation signal domain-containing protein [bacterium]
MAYTPRMFSRRDFLKATGQTCVALGCAPLMTDLLTPAFAAPSGKDALRCINVINFIREIEPRFKMDMMLPVQKQMELLLEHKLPATWLLQFDALVSGPFVEFLKTHMAPNHEVGFWFEMNEKHCKTAEVEWRGRPGYEWDHIPHVAFTIGYTEAERIKLADTAMREFKRVWGRYPSSVASWNLDSFTMAHLTEHYGIDAYAVCRDQIATDGFTIWGAPIAGYYPSKANCWSPALSKSNQISTPVFRMLGQDPVYYYQKEWTIPGGRRLGEPDTMEPVWTSGRSPHFIDGFLNMIAEAPTLRFAYAQLGQENTFPWDQQKDGYPIQMKALAELRDKGEVHVETMGDSGRRFKRAFTTTPAQAQVQLEDPFGNTDPAQKSVWYQSRFYRANLHIKGDLPFLRDLTTYSDTNPQPFLKQATRLHDVEQRMPAILDGYHWSKNPGSRTEEGAGGYLTVAGTRLRLSGTPKITESGSTLTVEIPVGGEKVLCLRFEEKELSCWLTPKSPELLTLSFEWDSTKAPPIEVTPQQVAYKAPNFAYKVSIEDATATSTPNGWTATAKKRELTLNLAQPK